MNAPLLLRQQHKLEPGVRVRVAPLKPPGQNGEPGARCLEADASGQTTDHHIASVVPNRDVDSRHENRHHRGGGEQLGAQPGHRPVESLGGDPDDGEGLPVEPNGFANRVGTTSESALPEAVAQYEHRTFFGYLTLIPLEESSCGGRKAQRREEVAAHEVAPDALVARRSAQVQRDQLVREYVVEEGCLLAHLEKVGIGGGRVLEPAGRLVAVEAHEALRLGDRQAFQQESVGEREGHGIGANPERECQCCKKGKPGVACERAHRITQILCETEVRAAHAPCRLRCGPHRFRDGFRCRRVDLFEGSYERLVVRKALRASILESLLEMGGQLFQDLLFSIRAHVQPRKSTTDESEPVRHGGASRCVRRRR